MLLLVFKLYWLATSDLEEKRAVSTEMGENLAAEHNIPFIETSAKSGLNVREAFYNLVGVIMEKVCVNQCLK